MWEKREVTIKEDPNYLLVPPPSFWKTLLKIYNDGLPRVRGKFLNIQKSSVRGKQNFAQRGIFTDPSQHGNDISAVCGKNQSIRGVRVGSEVSFKKI